MENRDIRLMRCVTKPLEGEFTGGVPSVFLSSLGELHRLSQVKFTESCGFGW